MLSNQIRKMFKLLLISYFVVFVFGDLHHPRTVRSVPNRKLFPTPNQNEGEKNTEIKIIDHLKESHPRVFERSKT